jgi:hypothetical protein
VSDQKCKECGNDTFHWSFTGWDKVTIDSEGAYHRTYKGEYQDSEVTCAKCEAPFEGDD